MYLILTLVPFSTLLFCLSLALFLRLMCFLYIAFMAPHNFTFRVVSYPAGGICVV